MHVPVTAKSALLQALTGGPGYGLELVRRVDERTNGKIKLADASVYPALRALARDGLLRSWEGDPGPERGGIPRRYYELTAQGLRAARRDPKTVAGLFAILGSGRAG